MVNPKTDVAQMIAAVEVLIGLFLSLAAIAGLLILHHRLARLDPYEPINARFIFAIRVTLVLFAGRALMIMTGGAWFKSLVYIGAALVPLAVLLLTEGLLRRHAGKPLKAAVGCGAILFVLLAVFPTGWVDPARVAALMIFQVTSLIACGIMVWSRDQSSLSVSENMTAVRLGLSLILLIPLCLSDYFVIWLGLPMQISALGVLIMCWLAISLSGAAAGQRATLKTLFGLVAASLLASVGLGALLGANVMAYVLSFAGILAAVLVASIAAETYRHRQDIKEHALDLQIANAPKDDAQTFLRSITTIPGLETSTQITAAQLTEIDLPTTASVFKKHPIIRAANLPPLAAQEAELVAHLLAQTDASHLMQILDTPFTLIAMSLPSLTQSQATATTLALLRQQATNIAKQGHTS